MSKKARRKKHTKQTAQTQYVRPLRPLEMASLSSRLNVYQVEDQIQHARQQMRIGDFTGTISTCEHLLATFLKRHSEMRIEVLMMMGLAHGMLRHYQQSYDIFSEVIGFDSTLAEAWYNRGLACSYMSRPAEAVRNFERAVELSSDETDEMASKFAIRLEEERQELQEILETSDTGMTLTQYIEREEYFTQAMDLVRQEKWPQAERLFRRLTETGARVPSYWGNLAVCLMMQSRYDEAEEALKQALAIDPDYPIARDNLQKLAEVRRTKQPLAHKLVNLLREEDEKQSLALYEKNEQGDITSSTVVERVGHVVTSTWRHFGEQPPRYNFLLNMNLTTSFTTCPQCETKTRSGKFPLVLLVNPGGAVVLDKICRFCSTCDLLIVHQGQLKAQFLFRFLLADPPIVGSDYQIVGTLDRADWKKLGRPERPDFGEIREYLHDFKEIVTL